jgi:branched-chain amino acid transport system permease protein
MAMGVNVKKIGALVFVLGAMLGALGGALAVPVSSLTPGMGAEMIVVSFTVVATAGLGQITGALITSLMIGLARSLAVYLLPEIDVAMPYIIMLLVLLVRPNGLFTVAQSRRI